MDEQDIQLSTAYKKFFQAMENYKNTEVEKWTITQILGYFCERYRNYYGMDYTFSYSSTAPSKSEEVWRMKSIAQNLSADPTILKNYIDWIFTNKVQLRKKKITSLGYLANREMLNDFKFNKLAKLNNNIIDRTTKLPEKYLSIVFPYNSDIENYGQLAFFYQMNKQNKLFDELTKSGFDIKIFDTIK